MPGRRLLSALPCEKAAWVFLRSSIAHLPSGLKKKEKKKKEKDTSLWSLEPFYAERIQKLWWPITLSVLPWSRLCSRHNACLFSAERYKQTHALKQTHLCIIRLCWESISIAMMTRVSVTYFCQDCSYNLNRYQNPAETCQLSPATETTSGNSKFFFFYFITGWVYSEFYTMTILLTLLFAVCSMYTVQKKFSACMY